ncbi:MAG: glycosyl hydrolase family 8 [Bacteroidales bacterium]|jgi:oligosaccharide reducing-end xylanase|nr:glycosyl hydrolase family 8 [Bacteroidales bacterium]
MKTYFLFPILLIFMSMCTETSQKSVPTGAVKTGEYRNLFAEVGIDTTEIIAKRDSLFHQLFYGDDSTERVYYPLGSDMAYVLDTYNNDVRSEGMSYAMMICVQMDKKEEFDKLWKFAKTVTQNHEGARKGYFGWSADPQTMSLNDANPAPDGEEYYVTALFFAAHRWGNGEGIFNYEQEANYILHHMIHKEEENGGIVEGITNMINHEEKKIVFVPLEEWRFSDPSYHLPAFYKLWAQWAEKDTEFWQAVADTSEQYLVRAMHPETGLATEYMTFDAEPQVTPFNPHSHQFSGDSWRVAMNLGMDAHWFGVQKGYTERANALLKFFYNQAQQENGDGYFSQFEQDGTPLEDNYKGVGLYAMNAVAVYASTYAQDDFFVKHFWKQSLPTGTFRYYNGLLYMLGYLHVSGDFRVY